MLGHIASRIAPASGLPGPIKLRRLTAESSLRGVWFALLAIVVVLQPSGWLVVTEKEADFAATVLSWVVEFLLGQICLRANSN